MCYPSRDLIQQTSAVRIEGLTLLHCIAICGAPQRERYQETRNAACSDTGVILPTFWAKFLPPSSGQKWRWRQQVSSKCWLSHTNVHIFLNTTTIGFRWRWVLGFKLWLLYLSERAHRTHYVRGWVGPNFSLDTADKIKMSVLPGIEAGFVSRPACYIDTLLAVCHYNCHYFNTTWY